MIIVRVFYKDGHEDLKQVFNVDEICLDGVLELRIIRRVA
jgi:hypothetical protein